MKVLPSTSWMREPAARRMKRGEPPTALKARTGLSTPPGRIQIGERGLHHHHIRALFDVELHLAQRFGHIRGIQLVRTAVAELRRRRGSVAERSVERGAVLGGVRQDRRILEAALIERLPDGAD